MKNLTIISLFILVLNLNTNGQATKTPTKPTTTVKKIPAKTSTTTKSSQSTTTVKKTTTTSSTPNTVVAPAPAATSNTSAPVSAPVEVTKQPSGPPATGAINDGPKSYSNSTPTNSSNTKTVSKTATKTSTNKTAAPKPEKPRNTSQEAVRSYIGIIGGYNLSTVEGAQKQLDASSVTGKVENLPGYMGGLVFNIGLTKSFSIQPEVLYSQQGLNITSGTDYFKGKIDIVNVPLLLKLAFGSPNMKFFINAGPYIGYKLSQKSETSLSGTKMSDKIDFITDYGPDGIKSNMFDFGGIGGAGLQFSLGGPLLVLEGRYQYGMADPNLYKNGKPAEVGNLGHQRVITGTASILFPLGSK